DVVRDVSGLAATGPVAVLPPTAFGNKLETLEARGHRGLADLLLVEGPAVEIDRLLILVARRVGIAVERREPLLEQTVLLGRRADRVGQRPDAALGQLALEVGQDLRIRPRLRAGPP